SLFRLLQVRAWVIGRVVAYVTVDLKDTGVVRHDVIHNRTRVGVLTIGVDVHLDDAVGDRLLDLLLRGARATVEDEIVAGVGAEALFDGGLAGPEGLGPQPHRARPVNARGGGAPGGEGA